MQVLSAQTDYEKLTELNGVAKHKQNQLTAGENITITSEEVISSINEFNTGYNEVSSLTNIPTNKRAIVAIISTSQEITFATTPDSGKQYDVYINNSSSSSINITIGGNVYVVAGSSKYVIHFEELGDELYSYGDECGSGEVEPTYSSGGVGNIVFYDSQTSSKIAVDPNDVSTSAYPTSRYTPIGVIVVPQEHNIYGTGEGAMISLMHMDASNPDTGDTGGNFVYWGYNNSLIGGAYNVVVQTGTMASPTESASGTASQAYLPGDMFNGSSCPTDPVAYYESSSSTSAASPSPYASDGGRNSVYYQTSSPSTIYNALSDLNGLSNTTSILNAVTVSNWKTSSVISNSYSQGNYPAACCCWRYHTTGTSQGDWYLPSCGELGYVAAREKTINNALNKVISTYGNTVASAIESLYYLSSTEYSSSSVRYYFFDRGLVSEYGKDDDGGHARAFCRVSF